MATRTSAHLARPAEGFPLAVLQAGAVAGLIGGVVMALFAMLYGATLGSGLLTPLKLVAATWRGVDALTGGAGAVLLGLLTHLAVAIGWGVLFSWAVRREAQSVVTVGWGLVFGVGVMIIMRFFVLSWADATLRQRIPFSRGAWLVGHLLFGACLGLVPWLQHRFAKSEQR
jgi:hypothetical protein